MTEASSHATLDPRTRLPKAAKIWDLLQSTLADRQGLALLEIGTGSGAIANFFATGVPGIGRVTAVDIQDQRRVYGDYDFVICDSAALPFEDGSFDVIVSNHVVEHVGGRVQQALHFREIARLLREDGACYLATPSRWQFMEPHFRLPALSWLPRPLRDPYVRMTRHGERYDCDPMSAREVEGLMEAAGLQWRSRNADALRTTLRLEPRGQATAVLLSALVPVLGAFHRLSPTMVYLASKRRLDTLR